ncbi:cytochrome P450 [Mycena sp. CBHHK59/15]|nr:cytochrome P450 [Mycena sp. CBHHK59/15]
MECIHHLEGFAGSLVDSHAALGKNEAHNDLISHLVSGSDTTLGVLTSLIYFLLCDDCAYKSLKNELDSNFVESDQHLHSEDLEMPPYLNTVVQEALRLGAPFAGLPRVVPKDGTTLDGVFIPQGTIVGVPAYAQAILEENFWPEPHAFRPERWLPGGLGPVHPTTLFPFSSDLCVLRMVVACLLLTYDVLLAPGFKHDTFVVGISKMRTTNFAYPLTVVATKRSK